MALDNTWDDTLTGRLGTATGVDTDLADFGTDNAFFRNAYNWEPKKQHQFIMSIAGIPAYLIKTAAKPTISNGEITLDHINVQRYVKGKSVWSTMAITLYDPIEPSAAGAVIEWVRLHHESVTGRDGYSDFYKKDLNLSIIGPVGDIVSEWIIKGAFIKEATFGNYDWSTTDPTELVISVGMDYCILNY